MHAQHSDGRMQELWTAAAAAAAQAAACPARLPRGLGRACSPARASVEGSCLLLSGAGRLGAAGRRAAASAGLMPRGRAALVACMLVFTPGGGALAKQATPSTSAPCSRGCHNTSSNWPNSGRPRRHRCPMLDARFVVGAVLGWWGLSKASAECLPATLCALSCPAACLPTSSAAGRSHEWQQPSMRQLRHAQPLPLPPPPPPLPGCRPRRTCPPLSFSLQLLYPQQKAQAPTKPAGRSPRKARCPRGTRRAAPQRLFQASHCCD